MVRTAPPASAPPAPQPGTLVRYREVREEDIQCLRDLHAEMDRAILACYGWQDLDPVHGFHQNERGQMRCTVSPEARREINRRLLELNLRAAQQEEAEAVLARSRRG